MRHNGIHSVTIPIDLADVLLSSALILLLFARIEYIANYIHFLVITEHTLFIYGKGK
jgi:hypothetical protein